METGSFVTSTGLRIFYRYCASGNQGADVILCIHGLASDSRVFNYFAGQSSRLGYNVYAIDLPGYGMSDGETGDVSFYLTMNCLHDVITPISNKNRNRRIFLLGFSLGGLHALWYASLHEEMLNGVIVVAPHLRIEGVKRDPRSEPSKEVLSLALQKYSTNPAETVHIGTAVPTAFGELAGDEWIYMLNDPICNFKYSYRYIFDILIVRAEKVEQLYKIKIPILVLHGSNDFNVVPEQSKTFLSKSDSADKELKLFDCDHWFYNAFFYMQENRYSEIDRINVVKAIAEWIRSKTI